MSLNTSGASETWWQAKAGLSCEKGHIQSAKELGELGCSSNSVIGSGSLSPRTWTRSKDH